MPFFYYYDPYYWVILLPAILISVYAQIKVFRHLPTLLRCAQPPGE